MYLSRVRVNNSKYDTVKFFASLQVAHAAVEGCFADDDNSRKLWRIDYYHNQPWLIVLSRNKPEFTSLIEQFGFDGDNGEFKDYNVLLASLREGQQYRFRLCANPVRSLKAGEGTRGKIIPHVTAAYQEEWLTKKAEMIGTGLEGFSVVQRDRKKFKRNGETVTLHTAVYEGVLKITDVEKFRFALMNGIGRAKSYGCGLLTLGRL